MKKEMNPIFIVVIVVVVVAGLIGSFMYFSNPHTPLGVKYTPGVPPWMEKGASGGYKPYATPAGSGAPTQSTNGAPPMAGK
jgi:flagellar basal body-associated protein FliL